jgi:predicted SprT family Zn-dependent metalloprotease
MELKQAQIFAEDLIKFYCKDWRFTFDKSVRRFGRCSPRHKLISLSKALVELNTVDEVLNCILHEIAHVLSPLDNHGHTWQRVAKDIGCTGERCYGDNVITVAPKFTGVCPGCGREVKRFRRKKIACGICCKGVFNSAYLIQWRNV